MARGLTGQALSAACLALFGWVAIAAGLAPIGGALGAMPGPDLLFCVVALWSARRPTLTPAGLVLALGLARDLMGGGPVGAGALGLLVASCGLRWRAAGTRRRGFLTEWGAAAMWAVVSVVVPWAMLTLTLAPTPPVERLAGSLLATALAYPLIVAALGWAARVEDEGAAARGA